MWKSLCIVILFFTGYMTGFAQSYADTPQGQISPTPVKGQAYFSLGWHRIFYTNSTIHFRNEQTKGYDFRLIRARGIDDNDLDIGQGIDAPQWSVRIGYFFPGKNWGLELSYDHAKYILKQGQRVHLRGHIGSNYYDQDTLLQPGFIEYEHTDGANYYMLSLLKKKNLRAPGKKHRFDWLIKAGAGLVIPRTNSWIMGQHWDEYYHISGYVVGLENSLRYELVKNLFAEFSAKTVFASYSDVLIAENGRASQRWGSLQLLYTLAYQIPVGRKQ